MMRKIWMRLGWVQPMGQHLPHLPITHSNLPTIQTSSIILKSHIILHKQAKSKHIYEYTSSISSISSMHHIIIMMEFYVGAVCFFAIRLSELSPRKEGWGGLNLRRLRKKEIGRKRRQGNGCGKGDQGVR